MPRICYERKNFGADSLGVIAQANVIIAEYAKAKYKLTLRQLYYQFVSRDYIPNTMQSYKRLGSIINDARIAGKIDWDAIEDRTRNLEKQATWDSPKDILEACAKQFKFDWWEDQDFRVEVWVEKEALVGVIERTAYKYRCPYFACRGYTSQSEAWAAGRRFKEYNEAGQAVKVIHLGDHDPSGIDMTRDNLERLTLFAEQGDVEVIRVALNMDQVRQYNPPPNPAKLTDSRCTGYIRNFGNQSWELDALRPDVIDGLISSEIEKYIDDEKWEEAEQREANARERIAEMAENWKDDE